MKTLSLRLSHVNALNVAYSTATLALVDLSLRFRIKGDRMRMNRRIGGLSLLMAASYAVPAYAQQLDVPTFVDLASKGTDIANRCSSMTNSFLTVRVPPDHAIARASLATNALVPTAKPLQISPENANYLKQVDTFRLLLSSCGKQFAAVRGPIQTNESRFYGLIQKNALPRPDAQKVSNAMNAYNQAHQQLVKAILALSSDKQVESHVDDVIVTDFLAEAKN